MRRLMMMMMMTKGLMIPDVALSGVVAFFL
jgi:hypothetical protein